MRREVTLYVRGYDGINSDPEGERAFFARKEISLPRVPIAGDIIEAYGDSDETNVEQVWFRRNETVVVTLAPRMCIKGKTEDVISELRSVGWEVSEKPLIL